MTTGFPAVWGQGFWGNNVWEDVPDEPPPPDDTTYGETGITHSIEFSVMLRLECDIAWSSPPPAITPIRNYRAVMDDYRITGGIPVAPPTLDCAVPILVSVDPKGVSVPKDSRDLPADIDTAATLRWIAQDQYLNANDAIAQWFDTTGQLAWTSYDTWQPQLDDTYDYQIPRPHNAELVQRSALIFDSTLGSCMNTTLSIDPVNFESDIEFLIVLWTHPLVSGQQFSSILDNGQSVQGFHDMPYVPGDTLSGGQRQALARYSDKLVLWQSTVGVPMYWTQVSGGRPILYRIRYGAHPLMQMWGPANAHMSYAGPTYKPPLVPLCSDYILGRMFNRLDSDVGGGMHLFEINYYDHMLTDSAVNHAVAELDSCYAITA